MERSVWIGWDDREVAAYAVARNSIIRRMAVRVPVRGVVASDLRGLGLLTRPVETRAGPTGAPIMWDVISDAPMATQHACARFLTPLLARGGWAMFVDGDVLARADINRVFDNLDGRKAVYCVKHHHEPDEGVKMDGQSQTRYLRKNWSSMMIFNADHPANDALTVEMVNTLPGRDLHRFCWIEDDDLIGELSTEWNHLVGITRSDTPVRLAHFTLGTPDLPGYESVQFGDEWRAELARWAA